MECYHCKKLITNAIEGYYCSENCRIDVTNSLCIYLRYRESLHRAILASNSANIEELYSIWKKTEMRDWNIIYSCCNEQNI